MIDLAYIGVTVLFFGLMIVYVVGCDRLGRSTETESAREEMP